MTLLYRYLFPVMWLSWAAYWWLLSRNVKVTARHEPLWSRLLHVIPLVLAALLTSQKLRESACVTEDSVTFISYARQLGGEGPAIPRQWLTERRGPTARQFVDKLAEWCPALCPSNVGTFTPAPMQSCVTQSIAGSYLPL